MVSTGFPSLRENAMRVNGIQSVPTLGTNGLNPFGFMNYVVKLSQQLMEN